MPFGPNGPANAPGVSAVITPEGAGPEGPPALAPNVQVVRFQGPRGLAVEVLAPTPTPVSVGDGGGILTVGLERGVGYRLRLSNITERPGAELFPVIEVVGHLHRPREIEPGKYPIRVIFSDEELWDVVDRGRLVTKVIYLEEPEQAIPIKLAKDQIPVVSINPSEQPLKVARASGASHGHRPDRRPAADRRGDQRRRDGRPGSRRGGRDRLGSLPVHQHQRRRLPAPLRHGLRGTCRSRHAPGCPGTSTSATAATGDRPRGSGRTAT